MISLCITTYNRYEMLMESFAQVLNDDRISEIIIVDDCSDPGIFRQIGKAIREIDHKNKINLYRNSENLGMSLNKKRAVELAKEEWCILFDSDNVIGPDYLDAVPKNLIHTEIYCPSFARPQFDYNYFSGKIIYKGNAKQLFNINMGDCLFNTCNFLVNRAEYLKVYEHNPEMKGTDTIWFNYLWLRAGNSFYVVPGMEYYHRVHDGSGFMQDVHYNMKKAKEIKELIKAL